jgi:hypothetical protein
VDSKQKTQPQRRLKLYTEDKNRQDLLRTPQAEDAVVAEALEERVRLNLEMTFVASS